MPRDIRSKILTIVIVLILSILAVYPVQDTVVYTATVTDTLDKNGDPIQKMRVVENNTRNLIRPWAFYAHNATLGIFHSFKETYGETISKKIVDDKTVITRDVTVYLRGLTLGLDLTGGAELIYDIQFGDRTANTKKLAEDVKSIIEKRINAKGLMEPVIQLDGTRRLIVQIPQTKTEDIAEIQRAIEGIGHLEFRLLCHNETLNKTYKKPGDGTPEGYNWYQAKNSSDWLLVSDSFPNDIEVSGGMVVGASVDTDTEKGGYQVSLNFDARGKSNFYYVTSNNIGKRLAIILDDVREGGEAGTPGKIIRQGTLYSAPTIQSAISSGGRITGRFSFEEAETLRTVLVSGKLPAALQRAGVNQVGPTLGRSSVDSGRQAIVIGLIFVLLFMAGYYLLAGAIADFALVFNILLLVSALAVYNATLTLPGIAGIILTVGMSVDANVLIFERIREERQRRAEKPLLGVIQDGYKRALTAIIDANLTTLFTAAILYRFGTGPVRGFAVTLGLGIVFSLFTALFVTRTIFEWLVMSKLIKEVRMMQFIKSTNIAFLKLSPKMIAASLVVLLASIAMLGYRGRDILDTDFEGGTRLHVVMKEGTTDTWIRDQLATVGLGGSSVQSLISGKDKSKTEFLIRTPFIASPSIKEPESIPPEVNGKADPHGGGLKFEATLDRPFDPARLQKLVREKGHKDAVVKPTGQPGDDGLVTQVEVRVKSADQTLVRGHLVDIFHTLAIRSDVARALTDKIERDEKGEVVFASITATGPSVADEMQTQAILAITLSLLVIVAYIWFRFELRFGLAAIAALVHDVVITIGVLAILNVQINLHIVAALLTIIGYSLNDTIVLFDRIRENLGTMRRETYETIVNTSINQTLSRTLLTSVTTLGAVGALYFWGGGVIHDFALALLIGVLVGTYSSIFVASPIVVWARKRDIAKRRTSRT